MKPWKTFVSVKEYFRQLNNEIITIEVPQAQIPTPENIIQPLLGYQNKPGSAEIIREIQESSKLHEEIKKMEDSSQNTQQRIDKVPGKWQKEKHQG
jgi:hypothetical protein